MKDPSEWSADEQYVSAKKKLETLKVVNDHAERGIKLVEDFNRKITQDEEQFQYLLTVVGENRKKFPKATKEALTLHGD